MHTCLASILLVLSVARAGPRAPLPADDDAPSPSLPAAVGAPAPLVAPARPSGPAARAFRDPHPNAPPPASGGTAPAEARVPAPHRRKAKSKAACAASRCKPTAFVRYTEDGKLRAGAGAGRRAVPQQPAVNPAVCAVF